DYYCSSTDSRDNHRVF
nr:immunoglobulin light chain junction region [Macaca mulatta]MOV72255.1 immunoglobulin light chain junction region [Macaca mulatta]MOV72360.1 immunoglobulin light chain junction region [Macaca mulatta]MOV72364.1 immunoglobulin light chain junction region [Macaca mulatta]MOV72456.1 immunoglobulin light chain junction region [Macaca mulatta]